MAAAAVPSSSSAPRELTRVLADSLSIHEAARTAATERLQDAERQDFERYVTSLVAELVDEAVPEDIRNIAGLLVKNAISGKEPAVDKVKRSRWLALSKQPVAAEIRHAVLSTLSSSACAGAAAAAAQVLAKIGRLDVPAGVWPNMVPALVRVVTGSAATGAPESTLAQRKQALTALQYFCEDLQLLGGELGIVPISREDCNLILTAVVHACRSCDMQLAGYKALYFAISLARDNMNNEVERSAILKTISDGLCLQDAPEARLAAFETTVQVATHYYSQLGACIHQWGEWTVEAINAASQALQMSSVQADELERLALASVEFWTTVVDEELNLGGGSAHVEPECQNYVAQARHTLLPVLLRASVRSAAENGDEADDTVWNLASAAALCVTNCALLLGKEVDAIALPFIGRNFRSHDWRQREAAVMIYGCIAQGPSSTEIKSILEESLPLVCCLLKDPVTIVRQTTAWSIGRVAGHRAEAIRQYLQPSSEPQLLKLILTQAQTDVPRVATYLCFAAHEIGRSFSGSQATLAESLVEFGASTLLEIANRPDATQDGLRTAALEALTEIVAAAGGPTSVLKLKMEVVETLHAALSSTLLPTATMNEDLLQVQGQLCGSLGAIIDNATLPVQAGKGLLQLLLQVLRKYRSNNAHDDEGERITGPDEDALLAIVALPKAFGVALLDDLPDLSAVVKDGLKNVTHSRYCRYCASLVSEVAGSITREAAARIPRENNGTGETWVVGFLMEATLELLNAVSKPEAPTDVKTAILSTLADCCEALGKDFRPFVDQVVVLLGHAQAMRLENGPHTEEWMEFLIDLRDAVADNYSALLHTQSVEVHAMILAKCVPSWLEFVRVVLQDSLSSAENLHKAVDLLSDLLTVYRKEVEPALKNSAVLEAIEQIKTDDNVLKQKIMFFAKLHKKCL